MKNKNYDFCGWATVYDQLCADGRVIRHGAFDDIDGETVPLVYNHQHNAVDDILGHALMECRPEGVYAYCYLNDTPSAEMAKMCVEHGDLDSLSIFANHLSQNGVKPKNVVHGEIKELSLVLAGANPGAFIEDVITHGDMDPDDFTAYIYSGQQLEMYHDDTDEDPEDPEELEEPSVEEVLDSMSPLQYQVAMGLVGQAMKEAGTSIDGEEDPEDPEEESEDPEVNENEEEDPTMKHNLFDGQEEQQDEVLMHSEIAAAFDDVRSKRTGSLKDAFMQHGITNIEYLFPDEKNLNTTPEFIKRPDTWVTDVMNSVHHTPFARIKSTFADITEDEARAKGYIKGKLKKEEVFSLLKRTTTPQTVYKKQKLDRDDVIDITDLDVVAWIKTEMRMMLNEEIARAILVGDGRLTSSDDKIKEDNIRPIWKDSDLFTIKQTVEIAKDTTAEDRANKFIEACVRARKNYKGSGNPKAYASEDIITDCLLLKDKNGRIIYDTIDKLATACRVSSIVSVPVMEGLKRTDEKAATYELGALIVNLVDYNVGADKGGEVNMFDDFDIDYNALKYLIETRISGALIKPYSAIAVEFKEVTSSTPGQSSNAEQK